MLLGFKPRFEPYVIEGSKTHTIRRKKRIRPRAGEVCHCFGDVRQKTMHVLGRWPCIAVDHIRIDRAPNDTAAALYVTINGVLLSADEVEALFWRDGFREPGRPSALQARDFWDVTHDVYPFEGDLIHWDFARPLSLKEARGR